ncbi:MAG: nitroreductase family protein [Cyclobacteriaceae bacterium]|jgi:nitroreductase|nr:nitroreductase family protein [Flammeovirgaceae bacterium]
METQIIELKSNTIEHPVFAEIRERKSRRAYLPTPVSGETIKSLFEAARWAPSSSNEQPWAYLYATKDQPELWEKIFDSLMEGNKLWTREAPLLVVSMVRKNFLKNDKPNGSARFDLGAANAFLSLQATHLGLNVHQMGGFEKDKIIGNLNIPDTHEPVVVLAIGYPGTPEQLAEPFKTRETALRERYTQAFFVMNNTF